jgi:hypothetical protein
MNKINIDKLHEDKLKYFEKRKESLKMLYIEKEKLEAKLDKYKITERFNTDYMKVLDKFSKVTDEIKDIIECTSEFDYLFSIKDILKNCNIGDEKDLSYGYQIATGAIKSDPRDSKMISLNCKDCDIELTMYNGMYTCTDCGNVYDHLCMSNDLTYKQMGEIDFRSKFVYEKKTYLTDWLNKFQAKDGITISDQVLDIIKKELKKERITEYSNVKETKIREILKKLKLKEYYDCTINIVNKLSGRPPFIITDEIKNKIHIMFEQIQIPHEIFKPEARKNFISYPYFIKKFFMILGLFEIAEFYQYPKSHEKVQQLDETFIKIVDYMKKHDTTIDWKFYPSF